MIVWVVCWCWYDEFKVSGLFDSLEKAQKFISSQPPQYGAFDIEEMSIL